MMSSFSRKQRAGASSASASALTDQMESLSLGASSNPLIDDLIRKYQPSPDTVLSFLRQLTNFALSLTAQQLFCQKYEHISLFTKKVSLSRGPGDSRMGHAMFALVQEGLFESMVELLGDLQEIYDPFESQGGKFAHPSAVHRYPYAPEDKGKSIQMHDECIYFWSFVREVARALLNGDEKASPERIPSSPHRDPIVHEARKFIRDAMARSLPEPKPDLMNEYLALLDRHLKGTTSSDANAFKRIFLGIQGPLKPPKMDFPVSLIDVCIARTLLGFLTEREATGVRIAPGTGERETTAIKAQWDAYGRAPMVRKALCNLLTDSLRDLVMGKGDNDHRKDAAHQIPLLAWTATQFEPGTEKTVFTPVIAYSFREDAKNELTRLAALDGLGGRGLAPCVSAAFKDLSQRIRSTTGREGGETDEEADARLEVAQDLMDLVEAHGRVYQPHEERVDEAFADEKNLSPEEIAAARRVLLVALATAAIGPGSKFYPPTIRPSFANDADLMRLVGRLASPQTLAIYAQFVQILAKDPIAAASVPTPVIHRSMEIPNDGNIGTGTLSPPRLGDVMEKFVMEGRIRETQRKTVPTQLFLPTSAEAISEAALRPMSHRFPDTRRITVFAGVSPVDLQVVRYSGQTTNVGIMPVPVRSAVQLQDDLIRFFEKVLKEETTWTVHGATVTATTAADLLRGGPDNWLLDYESSIARFVLQYHPVVDAFSMISLRTPRYVMSTGAMMLLFHVV